MELAEPALGSSARPCPDGGTARSPARTPARRRAPRRSARRAHFACAKPPSTIPATCHGSPAALRSTRARSRTARRRRATARWRAPRRRGSGSSVSGARRLGGERLRQDDRPRPRRSDGVYASEAAADEDVLHTRRAAAGRQPPEHRLAARQRERDLRQLEACDLLDEVDLARHVARAPRRDAEPAVAVDVEADAARGSRPAARRPRRARAARLVRSGRNGDRAEPAASPWTSAAPVHRAPVSWTRAASRAPPPGRRGTGRRPSPSGSSPRCAGRAARSCGGSRPARSSPPRAGRRRRAPRPRSPRRP